MFVTQIKSLPFVLIFCTALVSARIPESELDPDYPAQRTPIIQSSTIKPTLTTTAQYLAVTNADMFGGQQIQILLPPAVTATAQFAELDTYKATIQQSLPFLLKQLGVTDDQMSALVADGAAFLSQALLSALNNGTLADPSALLVSRGLEERCWPSFLCHWAENIKCSVFAAGALPGYLLALGAFRVLNPSNGGSTTYSEEFYLRPQYGPLSQNVHLYQAANYPPGWNSIATTFGHNIYFRDGYHSPNPNQAGFQASVRLLLHEMKHISQESQTDFDPLTWGLRYMFEFCKADFSYAGNHFEQDAFAMEHVDDDILSKNFLQSNWLDNRLYDTIGYPKSATPGRGSEPGTLPGTTTWYTYLFFDGGAMDLQDNGNCWRTYTNAELAVIYGSRKGWTKRDPNGAAC